MKLTWQVLTTTFALAALVLTGCASKHEKSVSWQANMQKFADLTADMMPLVHKKQPLTDLERARLEQTAKDLRVLSSQVSRVSHGPSNDPQFQKNAAALEQEFNEIENSLRAKHDLGAVRRMSMVTSYCISCHTLREGVQANYDVTWNKSVSRLSNRDKAEFFAATRQFDNAIIHYEYALTDKEFAKNQPEEWNVAALRMLAIVVRVKNNPNLALEMVSRFFDAHSYPDELKPAAKIWRKEIQKWETEEKSGVSAISIETVERLLKEGDQLKGPARARLIHDLRASRILHLLKTASDEKNADYQRLLLYSGQVGARIRDLNSWDQPQDYLALCVKANPKSATAKTCKSQYKTYWATELGEKDLGKWPASVRAEWEALNRL